MFVSPPKLLTKESDHHSINFKYLPLQPEDPHIAYLPAIQIPWAFKCRGPLQTAWTGKAPASLVILGGGLVFFHSCSSSCCSFFGCCLRKFSCSDPNVFYDRMQRTLRCLTLRLNQAEGTFCFPSLSTQPSIQPVIDDSLYKLKKGEMCKTSDEGLRNNIFLITSIIIITVPTTPRIFRSPEENHDWLQRYPVHLNPDRSLQTTTRMTGNGLCTLN